MAKLSVKDWSLADHRYGWKIGCEGWATIKEAATLLGYVPGYVYQLLKLEDRQNPTSRAFPLRAANDPISGCRLRLCVRSIKEFHKLRALVEI